MSFNKVALAAAVAAGLFAGTARAAVDISDPDAVPLSIAAELEIDADGIVVPSLSHRLDVDTALGYSFSPGEIRYARLECSGTMTFVTPSVTSETNPATTIGAVNGIGTSAIHFSITSGATPAEATDILRVHGRHGFSADSPIRCEYGLYDQPSQAAEGGTAGRIASSSGDYARFVSSYLYEIDAGTETASVEADPSFSAFLGADADTAMLATVAFDTRAAITAGAEQQPIGADGTFTTLGDILAGTTAHVVTGDFSLAFDAQGDAVPGSVFIDDSGSCGGGTALAATAVTATTATFETGAAALDGALCYTPAGGTAIPVSDYSISLVPVGNAGYAPGALGPVAAGSIVHDGTQLQAPLAQVPRDWLSRMVLTNTGPADRAYSIEVIGEEGTTIGTGNLTGTVPAHGVIVVDLRNVLDTFSEGDPPRATLDVTVAGPNDQIQGMYQIVNPGSGSISNHVMVRPGSN